MSWFTDYIDLLNISIAAIAVGLSVLAVVMNRRQRRLDAFLKVMDLLQTRDFQEGRRLLFVATRAGRLPDDDGEFLLITRALANFNTVALFAGRGVIPKDWILDAFHHTLREMRVGYDSVTAYRRRHGESWSSFADLDMLIRAAERFRSNKSCCAAYGNPPPHKPASPLPGGPAAAAPDAPPPSGPGKA